MTQPRRRALTRYFPILGWGRGYTREDLSGDLIAGTITAILLVPQGMGFGPERPDNPIPPEYLPKR